MWIYYELGINKIPVKCHVNLQDEEVTCVMFSDVNIIDTLEIKTLDDIVYKAQQKFVEDMKEP